MGGGVQKFLFSAGQILCQKLLCHFVAINCLKRFRIVTQPRFRQKSFYVKLTTFSVAKNIEFDTKLMPYSESTSKMNMRSRWTVFEIFITSAVISIQRVSHENETM